MLRGSLKRGLALVRRRTPTGPALRVVLYEKQGCGLCAETYRTLTRVRMGLALEIERVDIEGDPALFRRYAISIPVLRVGDAELEAAGVTEEAVRRWLTGVGPALG